MKVQMTNTDQQLTVGGKRKGLFRWLNDLYNRLFGSLFGYTDTVQLGGGSRRRRHRKNKTHKRH